jgi:hypothetical protein
MVRDWELVRAILLATESSPPQTMASPNVSSEPLRIDGYDDLVVTQHVVLLEQKGLVTANYITANGVGRVHARNVQLTWDGHEFLDNARNDTIWRKSQDIAKRAGSVSFDVLKAILVALVKERLGIGGGS